MEIAGLQAFASVAEHGSFSVAAQALHLSQPAVSKRIAALESELDARLLDRVGRRVTLTEAGQALLPRARRILDETEQARRAIADLAGTVKGRLSMATSHHIGLHRLPPVLRAYTARHAGVELDLRFLDSETACSRVERGELELAVVTLPASPGPGLIPIALWSDPLEIVASTGHPLAARRHVTPAEMASYPAILPPPVTFTRRLVDRALAQYEVRARVAMETGYLETIRMMVAVGLGWSALPRTMLGDDLVCLPGMRLGLERQLGLVHHRGRTLSNAARAFVAVARQHGDTA